MHVQDRKNPMLTAAAVVTPLMIEPGLSLKEWRKPI